LVASPSVKTYKPTLQLADINEDGSLDIVAANGRRNTIEILFGDGQGQFSAPSVVKLEPGYNNYSFALGDIDGDAHLDLVAASSNTDVEPGLLVTKRGDGKGGFKDDPGPRSSVPSTSRVGAIADLNGDHQLDVVLNQGADLSVLLNQGNGKLAPMSGSPWPLGWPTFGVVVADMNRDQSADLIVTTVDRRAPYPARVAVLIGADHGFAPALGSPFPVGPGAYNVVVGDVNEDGKPDIAASSFEGDGVTILLGR
jgi:FG-GAP-like repeat